MIPEDLKYSETHEWVRAEDDLAVIGLTDYAQSELGDIVFLELPQTGVVMQRSAVFGTIESVKTVSDLITPVSGEIVEVNEDLPETPELVNDEPYKNGWMVIIKMENPSEIEDLMDADQYEVFLQER